MAGIATGYMAAAFGPRYGLLIFGLTVIVAAMLLTAIWVKETLHWAKAEGARYVTGRADGPRPRLPRNISDAPTSWEVFTLMSWRDRRMFACCQAGLVEKFVDALVWAFYPVFLYQQGLSLAAIGWVVGVYGFAWGGFQLITGRLSDRVGRRWPNILGMWICGAGVGLTLLGEGMAWWSFSAAVTGFGMALLYPNLSAAVADIAHPNWRGSAIGIYRFWRDLGYGIGGLVLGLASQASGALSTGFWLVAAAMFLSGLVLLAWGEETHPGLNPEP